MSDGKKTAKLLNSAAPEIKKTELESGNPSQVQPKKKKSPLWRRILFGVLGTVVVIVAAILIFRDVIIENTVEKLGSRVLGTQVNIVNFRTSLLGTVELTGFTVKNPPGYHNENAFQLAKVAIEVSVPSLLTSKIEVKRIYVGGLQVDFEVGLGKSNLGELQKNVNMFLAKFSNPGVAVDEELEDTAEKNEKSAKQLVIRDLTVENYAVKFGPATLPLVPVHMTDVGEGQPIGSTFNQLYDMMLKAVTETVAKAGGVILDGTVHAGKSVMDGAEKAGKKIAESAGKAGKALKNVKNSIIDVFSGGKNK